MRAFLAMSFSVTMMIGGQLIVYPGAYHAFDISSLQTPVTYFGHHLEFNKLVTDQSREALHEFLEATMAQ